MTDDIEKSACNTGLVWQDISLSVPLAGSFVSRLDRSRDTSCKLLLDRLSGSISPGSMMAIMGPSGAGKSTLLDVLSCRKASTAGTVSFGSTTDIKSISSYVEQHDALLGVLTVRETVWFSAKLSLAAETPVSVIDQRTDLILSELGLASVAAQRIGTPIQRGISGGQKRRVSIACSLVTLPRVLFLDEPTSGLDTFTAHEVMAAVKRMAKKHGMAVLATIHSPNWEIFDAFDRVLLLSKGSEIYQGETRGVAGWFGGLGWPCGERTNPADLMIELVNDDFAKDDEEQEHGKDRGNKVKKGDWKGFAEAWAKHSAQAKPNACSISSDNGSHSYTVVSEPTARASSSVARLTILCAQTLTLTRRNLLNYTRNLLAYGVRFAMYLGMGILLATVWLNLSPTDTRINDRLSVHFFSVAFLGFMSVAGIPAFLEERSVLVREASNQLYSPLAFTLAQTVSTLPVLFLCSSVFSVIAYWSIGLHPGAVYFGRFLAYLYLGVVAAEFQALLIAAILPVFVAALAVCAFLNGFWMCVQGYFIRAVNLPRFWYYWAHWIDYETFAFDLLARNDFKGLVFSCQGSIEAGDCSCSFPSSLVAQGRCEVSGEDVLKALEIDGFSVGLYVGVLVIICLVYRVGFWGVLRWQLR